MTDEKKKNTKVKVFIVLMVLAAIGYTMQELEAAPTSLNAAKKAAVGVWIDDDMVMDRTAKMVFKKDGTYEWYLAVKSYNFV